jgi:hypothetical protein
MEHNWGYSLPEKPSRKLEGLFELKITYVKTNIIGTVVETDGAIYQTADNTCLTDCSIKSGGTYGS